MIDLHRVGKLEVMRLEKTMNDLSRLISNGFAVGRSYKDRKVSQSREETTKE